MKKLILAFVVLAFCACGSSKKKTDDSGTATTGTSLEQRVAEYMKLNEEMNIDKIMDYVYPGVFTIVPRPELVKAMKEGFESEDVKIEIESMQVDKMHPVFEMDNGSYAMINYSLVMLMSARNTKDSTAEADESANEQIRAALAAQYGEDKVSIDAATGGVKVSESGRMVAVKNETAKDWSFVSLKQDDPMMEKLFKKDLIDKLDTYK